MIKVQANKVDENPSEIALELFCGLDDLMHLRNAIDRLIDGSNDHFHLMDESWGGHDLEAIRRDGGVTVPHIKVLRGVDGAE